MFSLDWLTDACVSHLSTQYYFNVCFISLSSAIFLKRKKPLTPQKSAVNKDQWHLRNAISEGLHRNQQHAKYFTFQVFVPAALPSTQNKNSESFAYHFLI